MNAWWRQLGHSSAWAPTRRVRRTIRRSVRGFPRAAARAGGDGALSDLGLPAAGVGDRLPGVFVDGGAGGVDLGVLRDGDRVARLVVLDGVEHLIGEEPRVGAHRHSGVGPQAPHPRQGLTHEAAVAALRRSRPHPRMQHPPPVSSRTATSG